MLKSLTDAFKRYDSQQRGVIHINYEQVGLSAHNPCLKYSTTIARKLKYPAISVKGHTVYVHQVEQYFGS